MEKEKEKRKAVYNREADKKWIEKNKERRYYLNLRASARSFIRKHATDEDIEELKNLISERKKNGKSI